MNTITTHRTYEANPKTNKSEPTLYLNDGKVLRGMDQIESFANKQSAETVLRSTLGDPSDGILNLFAKTGCQVVYANFHSTGLPKGLKPEETVAAYHELGAELFRPLSIDPILCALRLHMGYYDATLEQATRMTNRIKAIARQAGKASPIDYDEKLQEMVLIAKSPKAYDEKRAKPISVIAHWEKEIGELASQIPLCIRIKEKAGIKEGWILAAKLVLHFKAFVPFDRVASCWHYAGLHVVEGRMPKRVAGETIDFKMKLRKDLWQLGHNVFVMGRKEPWRTMYEDFRRYEVANHATKCTKGKNGGPCEQTENHPTNMAVRKVVKEFVRQVFLEAKGIPILDPREVYNSSRT